MKQQQRERGVGGRAGLILAAVFVQALALLIGGYVTFRVVQIEFAKVVETEVIAQNRGFAETLASLFADELAAIRDAGGGDAIAYKSAEWERLQKIVESEALMMLPAGGFACLIEDSTGQLLCHPDIRDDPGLRGFSFKGLELRPTLSGGEGSDIVGGGAGVASGVSEISLGRYDYLAHVPIGSSGLRLVVHQPVDSLVQIGEENTRFIAAIAGVVLLIVLGVTGGGLLFLLRRYDGVHEAMNRQLHENLRTAQRIQESALPRAWPDVPGYDVAAWSRAAEETGGDTFDVVGLEPDGRGYRLVESGEALALGLLLADATGHGVGPAIAVTQLQAMVRIAWRTNRSLMDVVGLVSERLAASLPDGRFITAWLAKLDHRADEIEMFAAGQGPIFRVSAAGDVEALAADSYPLGIEAGVLAAEPRRVRLEPGDMVVVVSDGLLEQADARGEQFGNARMERLIAERRGGDAASLVSAIHAAVDAFCGGGQADDQTVLVVKRQVACKI